MSDSARCIIEVQAGLIAERPDPKYTRRYVITSKEWTEAEVKDEHSSGTMVSARALLMIEHAGRAQAYAANLMHPEIVNWVRTDWIWL